MKRASRFPPLPRFDRWVRGYTEGLSARELARLFEREASQAYTVLTREQQGKVDSKDGVARAWHHVKVIFLGFNDHLGPTRRLVFVLSLLAALLGLLDYGFAFDLRGNINFDASPLWFVISLAGLGFLLALEIVDQVRVRDELEVARALQSELLPKETPHVEGYFVVHTYQTANEVGGDYYDVLELPDQRVALVVGDASGHGIAAGLLMAIANATLKLAIDLDPSPPRVLELVNRALARTGDGRSFMSLFYGLLDPRTGVLEFAIAGHPFPYLRRRSGAVEEIGVGGLPLGLRAEMSFSSESVELDPGDLLVLYSDGLPEASDASDQAFGYARLQRLVRDAPTPQIVLDRVLEALREHLGELRIQDDFSLLVVGRQAPLPPVPDLRAVN